MHTHTLAGTQIHTHTQWQNYWLGVGGWGENRSYYWSKYCVKRWVFRPVLKVDRERLWPRAKGREFQVCTAEKEKTQSPCCFLLKMDVHSSHRWCSPVCWYYIFCFIRRVIFVSAGLQALLEIVRLCLWANNFRPIDPCWSTLHWPFLPDHFAPELEAPRGDPAWLTGHKNPMTN